MGASRSIRRTGRERPGLQQSCVMGGVMYGSGLYPAPLVPIRWTATDPTNNCPLIGEGTEPTHPKGDGDEKNTTQYCRRHRVGDAKLRWARSESAEGRRSGVRGLLQRPGMAVQSLLLIQQPS